MAALAVAAVPAAVAVPAEAAPAASPSLNRLSLSPGDTPSGLITPGTKVTLSCATVGAVIYYTLDGTPPTGASIRYTEPIEITQNGTQIRAVAIKNGMTNSEIIAFNFRFPDEEPTDPGKEPDEPAGNAVVTLKENAAQIKYLGAPSSYIRPNDPASRYEVVDMLAKLFDIAGVTAGNRFADVSENHKSTVELFAAAGIINGYEDGTFGGAREITRAELVKIISLLLGLDKTEVEGESAVALSDISGHWAESNIRKFVAKGYILGYPEGDFRPDQSRFARRSRYHHQPCDRTCQGERTSRTLPRPYAGFLGL